MASPEGKLSSKARLKKNAGRNGEIPALYQTFPVRQLSPFLFRQPFGLPPSPRGKVWMLPRLPP